MRLGVKNSHGAAIYGCEKHCRRSSMNRVQFLPEFLEPRSKRLAKFFFQIFFKNFFNFFSNYESKIFNFFFKNFQFFFKFLFKNFQLFFKTFFQIFFKLRMLIFLFKKKF